MIYAYFKLFGNIKSPHEANDLARLELESVAGSVKPVANFTIELGGSPLREFSRLTFADSDVLVADAFTHELAYGKTKGYKLKLDSIVDVTSWVKRLAYTREIFLFVEGKKKSDLSRIFPDARLGTNAQYVEGKTGCLFRLITHQYFLENSKYVSKLSRNENELDDNLTRLYASLTSRFYRIPASATLRVGKRLEDYFAIREEPSLYLSHYMHPYKGKFHPKMIRALLNYICPKDKGTIIDNFAGSGTLLVEASMLGLDSVGIEINPLSVLMCNVKCSSLTSIEPARLKKAISNFEERLKRAPRVSVKSASLEDYSDAKPRKSIRSEWKRILIELDQWDANRYGVGDFLPDVLAAKKVAMTTRDSALRDLFLLAISGAISEKVRRRQTPFTKVLFERLSELYLRILLFHKMNDTLKIRVGQGRCIAADARDLERLALKDLDGNINSPPYSTALNYIANDQPQLTILGFHEDLDSLRAQMIGFPGVNFDRKTLMADIANGAPTYTDLPEYAKSIICVLIEGGRRDAALRSYKFFLDTKLSVVQMASVLKTGAKYVTIIGNNNYKLDGENDSEEPLHNSDEEDMDELEFDSKGYLNLPEAGDGYIEVKNDKVLIEIAKQLGFMLDRTITRLLAKSSQGNIRYESIVILEKT